MYTSTITRLNVLLWFCLFLILLVTTNCPRVNGDIIIKNSRTFESSRTQYSCNYFAYVELFETNTSSTITTLNIDPLPSPPSLKFTNNIDTSTYEIVIAAPVSTSVFSSFSFNVTNSNYSNVPVTLTFNPNQTCLPIDPTIAIVSVVASELFIRSFTSGVNSIVNIEFNVDISNLRMAITLDCSPSSYTCFYNLIGNTLYLTVSSQQYPSNIDQDITCNITIQDSTISYPFSIPINSPFKSFINNNPTTIISTPTISPNNTVIIPNNGLYVNDVIEYTVEKGNSKPLLLCDITYSMSCSMSYHRLGNGDQSTYLLQFTEYSSSNHQQYVLQTSFQPLANSTSFSIDYSSVPTLFQTNITISNDSNWSTLIEVQGLVSDFYRIKWISEFGDTHVAQVYSNYPFGYSLFAVENQNVSQTNLFNGTTINLSFTQSYEENTGTGTFYGKYKQASITKMFTFNLKNPIKTPTIASMVIKKILAYCFTILIEIIGDSRVKQTIGIEAGYSSSGGGILVQGNNSHGIYLINYSQYFSTITLRLDSSSSLDFYNILNIDLSPMPIPNIKYIQPMDITYFSFFPSNTIDTSNGSVNVTLLFNVTNADINYKSTLLFSNTNDTIFSSPSFDIYWDYTNQMYRSDFQVPGRSSNVSLGYNIQNELLLYNNLVGYLGQNAKLSIWSNYTDRMPPIVTDIKAFPDKNVAISQTSGNNGIYRLGFTVTIEDKPNGLKDDGSSYIKIISNIDGNPYQFPFNSTYRIGGDLQIGVYEFPIEINLTRCVNQIFYPSEIYLVDKYDSFSIYPRVIDDYYMNPFYKTLFDPTMDFSVKVVCLDPMPVDVIMPNISQFTITPQTIPLDVGSLYRNVSFQLTTFDMESGISLRHNPIIYLHETQGNFIPVTHKQINIGLNSTTYLYEAMVPIRFGCSNNAILVSVYGIVDNQLNLKGFSSIELRNRGLDYKIMTTCSLDKPIITELYQRIYKVSNSITLNGYGFGNQSSLVTAYVDYLDGSGYKVESVIDINYLTIIIKLNNQIITNQSLKIKILAATNGNFSNEFIVNVAPPPSQILAISPTTQPSSPAICLGTPQCNSRGNCTTDGCVCNEPWSGPDCLSQIIIIPTPVINPTDPTIIINTGGNNTTNNNTSTTTSGGSDGNGGNNHDIVTKTIISIHSIRELSLNGTIINEYIPQKWTFTNKSNENITLYHYSSNLGTRETLFNVSIQLFGSNSSEYEFAGQFIHLPPYSVKMSMDLSSYDFHTFTNTLQVIMDIQLSTKDPIVKCSNEQYGLGNGNDRNDLQWMKLNIGDKSLYGNFIRRAIVDNRIIAIRNTLLKDVISNTTENNEGQVTSSAFVAINVPYYKNTVLLDPDFSHLVDMDGGQYDYDQCLGGQQQQKEAKSKIGIIVGVVFGCIIGVAIAIGTLLYIKKKRILKKQQISMKIKLEQLNS